MKKGDIINNRCIKCKEEFEYIYKGGAKRIICNECSTSGFESEYRRQHSNQKATF